MGPSAAHRMRLGTTWVVASVAAVISAAVLGLAAFWFRRRAAPTVYSDARIDARRLRLYRACIACVYVALIAWFHVARPEDMHGAEDGLPETFTAWNTHLQAVWWVVAAAAPSSAAAHYLLETALPSAWFVSFVVAFILAPLSPALLVSFEHLWNAILMSADVRWSEHVVRRHHALLPCAWAALYVARSWWRRAAGPGAYQWTYEFLALSDGAAIAWYTMLIVANVGVYVACARASERKLPRNRPELAPDAPEGAVVETITLSVQADGDSQPE